MAAQDDDIEDILFRLQELAAEQVVLLDRLSSLREVERLTSPTAPNATNQEPQHQEETAEDSRADCTQGRLSPHHPRADQSLWGRNISVRRFNPGDAVEILNPVPPEVEGGVSTRRDHTGVTYKTAGNWVYIYTDTGRHIQRDRKNVALLTRARDEYITSIAGAPLRRSDLERWQYHERTIV